MPYNVEEIFRQMEEELIKSYKRNMIKHTLDEVKEGFKWEMWQLMKLRDLEKYRRETRIIIDKAVRRARDVASGEIIDTFSRGADDVDKMLRGVFKAVGDESFIRMNRLKLDALLDAVNNDFDRAGVAALRLVDDVYRQVIFRSQVFYNAGVATLPKAVDMAAHDFLHQGINCIQYKNGARVNIASYAEMVLRTSSKKAYLTGAGVRAAEYGVYTVKVSSYGACSETCLPWQGRVYIDDVYAGGKPDGNHPLLSEAMAGGLYHPNCRHTHRPYFEGLSESPSPPQTSLDLYRAEQKQRAIERKIREWKKVEEGSIDPENKTSAHKKVSIWQAKMREHLKQHPDLRRHYDREKIF